MKRISIAIALMMVALLMGCNLELVDTSIFEEIEEENQAGLESGFAGGNGTEASPYQISNAEQFLRIGDEAFQEELLKGENDDLYFELTDDIDLRGHEGYVATVFSGTLDGNGHTIYGSNGMPYIFKYFFEDTTFKDFTVLFDSTNVTLLFVSPSMRIDEMSGDSYKYDKDRLVLTIDNVDYKASSDSYYAVRDSNFGFYVDGTAPSTDLYYDSQFEKNCWTFNVLGGSGEELSYEINLKNCDVFGNYSGGDGGSGAAVFVGGQLWGSKLTLSDCTFTGKFEGRNVSLVIANGNGENTHHSPITATNVVGNDIISYSGNGSLSFAVSAPTEGGTIDGVEGTYITLDDIPAVEFSQISQDQKVEFATISIPDAVSYDVKLYLPAMHWYTDDSYLTYSEIETSSNTFTVSAAEISDLDNIYIAKVMSSVEAGKIEGISISWETAARSKEGYKYAFVENASQWYLVINYEEAGFHRLYTDEGLKDSTDYLKYPSKIFVIARNEANSAVAVGWRDNIK